MAGPAFSPAASPVNTKMPVPMTTPTPKTRQLQWAQFLTQLMIGFLGVGDRLLDTFRACEVHRSPPVA